MERLSLSPARRATTRAVLLWMVLALAYPSVGAGQDATSPGLESGTLVRVRVDDGRELQGRLARLEATSLVLSDRDEVEHVLAADEVRRVWRWRSRTTSFAVGGAIVVGLGFGTLSAVVVHGGCETSSCTSDAVQAFLATSVAGALGGVAMGALLGSLASGWQEVDPGFGTSSLSWRPHVGLVPSSSGDGPGVVLGLSLTLPTSD